MSFAFMAVYTGDYLRDTRHLTPMKHGVYLLLLMHSWDQKGPLPLDEQECAGIANCRSADEVEALRYILKKYWIRMDDGFYNKRLQREIERAGELSKDRSEAGKTGAKERNRRYREAQARAKQLLGKCLAEDATPTPTPTTTPTPTPTPPRSKSLRLAADFAMPESWIAWAITEHKLSRESAQLEGKKFTDFWHAKVGTGAGKLDWEATWRNWIRNALTTYARPGLSCPTNAGPSRVTNRQEALEARNQAAADAYLSKFEKDVTDD